MWSRLKAFSSNVLSGGENSENMRSNVTATDDSLADQKKQLMDLIEEEEQKRQIFSSSFSHTKPTTQPSTDLNKNSLHNNHDNNILSLNKT